MCVCVVDTNMAKSRKQMKRWRRRRRERERGVERERVRKEGVCVTEEQNEQQDGRRSERVH